MSEISRIKANFHYGSGDNGTTKVSSGYVMDKDSPACELIGELDQCNNTLGWILFSINSATKIFYSLPNNQVKNWQPKVLELLVKQLQQKLSSLNGFIYEQGLYCQLDENILNILEERIVVLSSLTGDADDFVYFGNTALELYLDAFRVQIRTAERRYVTWKRRFPLLKKVEPEVEKYNAFINRLSTWAFLESRLISKLYRSIHGGVERVWEEGGIK